MRNAVHPRFYPFMCRVLTSFPASLSDSEWIGLSGAQVLTVSRGVRNYLSDLATRVDLSGGVNA